MEINWIKWFRVTLWAIGLGLFFYYLFPRLVVWLLPFLIAYFIMNIANPMICYCEDKWHMKRKIAAPLIVTMMIVVVGGIMGILITKIVQETTFLINNMLSYQDRIPIVVDRWYEQIRKLYSSAPPQWVAGIESGINQLSAQVIEFVQGMATGVAARAKDFTMSLPKGLFFTIVTIVSTYILAIDKAQLSRGIGKMIPKRYLPFAVKVKKDVFQALIGFAKAGFIMYTIVTFMVVLGLTVLGINYSLIIGILIGLCDIIPTVGVGLALIPWGLIALIQGNYIIGVGVLILYLLVILVRESAAPKIISNRIGLHPMFTIISSYVGLEIIGGPGLIAGPVIVIIIDKMYKASVFTELYKIIVGDSK